MAPPDYDAIIKKTILELIEELRVYILKLPNEKFELSIVSAFFEAMDPASIVKHCKENILPHRDEILRKDIQFFLNNKHIFEGLPSSSVDYYAEKLSDPNAITEEDRMYVFKYFEKIIKTLDKKKKLQ